MTLKIAEQPRFIADRVGEFLLEGDLEGIVSMFHPDCRMFFPPNEPPKVGKDAAREVFRAFIPVKPKLISNVTSEVINGDTALLHGTWRMEDQDGNVIAEGESTEVAKKLEHGGWVYFIDCPNGFPAKEE